MPDRLRVTPAIILQIWRKALEAEIGVRAKFESEISPATILNLFYEVRKQANDPTLDAIKITPLTDYELFLYKKTVEID